jgi:aminoglycoside phosphotransferase (APT) family kinase protein
MSAPALDEAGRVRDSESFDAEKIQPFLRGKFADLSDDPVELRQYPGGASNLTYLLKIGPRELILRRPPAGTKPKSGHDMAREFHALTQLHPHYPCPRPLAFCADETLIGSTFYVMEKITGVILRRDMPPGFAGTPEQSRALCRELFDLQIRLHALDFADIGLGDFGRPERYVERQVAGWSERFRKVRTDGVPDYEAVMAWLNDRRPPDSPRPGIIHNDFRLDNVVLSPRDDHSIVGVLDWEMSTLGDPLMDLGCSLAYWVEASDPAPMQALRMQPSHLPGMMTRREIVEYYASRTGREVGDFSFYYVFGVFRLAVIAQQIYFRWKLGQSKNPRFEAFGNFVSVLSDTASRAMSPS